LGFLKPGFWFFLSSLVLLGVGLLVLASAVKLPKPLKELIPAFGASLLIGGVLGATVDRWLKARLLRDAFKSLFGYVLPEQLRAELDWVYTRDMLCDRSDLTLTVTPIADSELLNIRIEWHRDLRNITSGSVKWRPRLSLDEWFHAGRQSRITALLATQDGVTHESTEAELPKHGPPDPTIVTAQLDKELSLKPGERITVIAEGEETRYVSDAWFLHVRSATANPRVTVHVPPSLCWHVRFENRAESVNELGPLTRELPGTLLPGQGIQVRWWPCDAPGTTEAEAAQDASKNSQATLPHSRANGRKRGTAQGVSAELK
jgi:hypothetical protein